jgi:hypothetical protein
LEEEEEEDDSDEEGEVHSRGTSVSGYPHLRLFCLTISWHQATPQLVRADTASLPCLAGPSVLQVLLNLSGTPAPHSSKAT